MASKQRLIDAYKLEDLVQSNSARYHHVDDIIAAIAGQPTVDAVEVVHGRWMVSRESEISKNVWCTACGEGFYISKKIGAVLIDKMPYCPNCGAKMDGGNEDGC